MRAGGVQGRAHHAGAAVLGVRPRGYCPRACQLAHWKAGHRNECAQLQQSAATRSTDAGAPEPAEMIERMQQLAAARDWKAIVGLHREGLAMARALREERPAEAAVIYSQLGAACGGTGLFERALEPLEKYQAIVVAAAEAELRQAATALDEEITETRLREREARATQRAEAARAQEALARANDLQEMLTALEREQARQAALAAARARQEARQARPASPVVSAQSAPPPPESARPAPVHGRISVAFGQRGEAGPARGVSFAASPGARVVSPCTGRAVFAGPFRRFGQIVILECGPGLHLVLAGFEQLDTEAGAALLAGEALGRLGAGPDGRAALYVELRRNGQVVDPMPWLGGAE